MSSCLADVTALICHRLAHTRDRNIIALTIFMRVEQLWSSSQNCGQYRSAASSSFFSAAMNTGQVQVELFDSPRQPGHSGESLKSVWCPHDRRESQVVVTYPIDLQVDKISVSLLGTLYRVICMEGDNQRFLGYSRVWTRLSHPTEELEVDPTSYKVRWCGPRVGYRLC